MRFCIAERWIAYRKFAAPGRRLALLCALSACSLPLAATELRPEVLDAIRRAAEAASAPAARLPAPALPVLPSASPAGPAAPAPAAAPPAPAAAPRRPASWLPAVRVEGRLQAADIGLVINTADPYSVAVGEYYIRRRGLKPQQVLRLTLPTASTLTRDEFNHLRGRIELRFQGRKPAVQALVLAWAYPYAVDCNSIGGALALGFDADLCANSCQPSRPSRYFNSASTRPWTDLGIRPVMHLAAPTPEDAKALIDRGLLADGSLARRSRGPVTALLLETQDAPRNVRSALYPPVGGLDSAGVNLRVEPALVLPAARRLLMVATGAMRLDFAGPLDWVPGGIGDHLTSYGGALEPWHGQSTVLEWIASGATGSHGTVSEPCNHLQKFPHPQVLLQQYLQGSTLIEAYWKSVAWPQQALFIGEPLAAPFAVTEAMRQQAAAAAAAAAAASQRAAEAAARAASQAPPPAAPPDGSAEAAPKASAPAAE
jgi:uncharacterized protein (TIGR03790 family)